MPVIEVEHLHKRYGGTVAVEDVSFTVERGETFGIVGPNGAGKTTTVETIEGLRVGEALELFACFYRDPADPDRLLEALGLDELSTGLDPPPGATPGG